MPAIERHPTDALTSTDAAAARALMDVAFRNEPEDERFTDDDWQHALGGTHLLVREGDEIVAHASVVPRTIHVGGTHFATGYVEAVAVHPDRQGQGIGSALMSEVDDVIRRWYEFGVLGSGRRAFYTRLGWQVWLGPTNVVRGGLWERSSEDDGYVLVLRFGPSADIAITHPIACEERPGDDW
jgi:aminoglycoside 2'-N-acetyltransferase I